jgi:hypothetical protein
MLKDVKKNTAVENYLATLNDKHKPKFKIGDYISCTVKDKLIISKVIKIEEDALGFDGHKIYILKDLKNDFRKNLYYYREKTTSAIDNSYTSVNSKTVEILFGGKHGES